MKRLVIALYLLAACLLPATCLADTKLPSILGNHMVLQRDRTVPIWGWDEPGQAVTVKIGSVTQSTKAGNDGRWQLELPAMPAGGPHQISIQGSSSIELTDVLFGEVWLCSGQSNMEWVVQNSDNAPEEIANAKYPHIRHIKIPHRPSDQPEQDVPSDGWKPTSPDTVASFTAVGYFFARNLQSELDVPIGLIGSNWGGTRIEPWTPPVGFKHVAALSDIASKLDQFPSKNAQGKINHQTPLALYNGMIHPLLPYSIRGAIWYQGESNRADGAIYRDKMEALITGWRKVWNQPDLPFYFVQLAPFTYGGNQPEMLPVIWEAQTRALKLPHTGMAVITDIGNLRDIHPRNKQEVGRRLSLWALAKTYGQPIEGYASPFYKSMKIEGNKIRLSFDQTGGQLLSRDNQPLTWFTIAGEDQAFTEAQAEVDGDTVVVWSKEVAKPVAVRFGWHQDAEPNLTNKAGLPASPFRTDTW